MSGVSISEVSPAIAALVAVVFGAYRNAKSDDEAAKKRVDDAVARLHTVYHHLVEDLTKQVKVLQDDNEALTQSNLRLEGRVGELTDKISNLLG